MLIVHLCTTAAAAAAALLVLVAAAQGLDTHSLPDSHVSLSLPHNYQDLEGAQAEPPRKLV